MSEDLSYAPYREDETNPNPEEENSGCSSCKEKCDDVWCRLRAPAMEVQDCGNGYLDSAGIFHAYE